MSVNPVKVVHRVLRERGSLDSPALLAAAREAGADISADELAGLLHDGDGVPEAVCLPHGRHGVIDGLLDGRIFTTRVTERGHEHDVLEFDPDLAPLLRLTDTCLDMMMLNGGLIEWGGELSEDRFDALDDTDVDLDEVFVLPQGTLKNYAVGSLVGLRVSSDGAEVVAVDAGPVPTDLGARIRRMLRAHDPPAGDDEGADLGTAGAAGDVDAAGDSAELMPLSIEGTVLALCADDPTLFTEPLRPLSELLEEFGLITVDGDIADASLDVDAWRTDKEAFTIAAIHRLSEEHAWAVAAVSRLVRGVRARLAAEHELDGSAADGAAGKLTVGGSGDDSSAGSPVAAGDSSAGDLVAAGDDAGLHDAGRNRTGSGTPDVIDSDPATRDIRREWIANVTALLAAPDAAEALLMEVTSGASEDDTVVVAVLGALAEGWESIAPRQARVAMRWLRARCAEFLGDTADAEAELHRARMLDDTWPLVLGDLARYADDRGDADAAISLLRDAQVDADDPELEFLQSLPPVTHPDLGRNSRCWCGSGRKYKVCHLGRETLPLESRGRWLYRKISRFAQQPGPNRDRVLELAQIRCRHDSSADALLHALHDPLVLDALLFEGDVAGDFLIERGDLLPDDERELLESWIEIDRSVFAVEEVRPGSGMTVRDIRTGDRREVAEKTASRSVRRDDRVLMRVVPVGETWQIFGGGEPLPMPMEERALELCDALADFVAGPEELVAFATSRFAPPTLVTRDGEPMVTCTAHYQVGASAGVDAVRAQLTARFEADGPSRWSRVDDDADHTLLGSVELDGRRLTVNTMNERRWEDLRAALAEIDGLVFVDVERTSGADMLAEVRARGDVPGHDSDEGTSDDLGDHPDVVAALADYIRGYEERWLDTELPALGGATPRAAADDPTRRGEVVRLLDSFTDLPSGPGTMDVARLRAALGL